MFTLFFSWQRHEIITGGIEPTDSDCDWPSDDENEEEKKLIVSGSFTDIIKYI